MLEASLKLSDTCDDCDDCRLESFGRSEDVVAVSALVLEGAGLGSSVLVVSVEVLFVPVGGSMVHVGRAARRQSFSVPVVVWLLQLAFSGTVPSTTTPTRALPFLSSP